MKKLTLNIIYLTLFLSTSGIKAQSLVDDVNFSGGDSAGNTFTETIKIISGSKKIFIITNNNQQLGPGDFVSLALEDKLAARALVAKTHQGQVGIKILKIYSLAQWGRLRRDQEVQIIKGDDTGFGKKAPTTVAETAPRIKDEDDLYSGENVVEDDLAGLDDNKNRHIKPDNIVSLFGAFYDATQTETEGGGTIRTNEVGLSWAYQFSDNYFVEGAYGRAMLNSFPADGNQTLANHLMVRLKYNFKGPLYTFFMPYVGFHTYSIQSPDAGKTDNEVLNREQIAAIEELEESGVVFGVTVMRRLVPGWFVRADIGTDLINVGFAVEF